MPSICFIEHLQLFGKMTCYPCFFGKRRKFLLQQFGIGLAKFLQVGNQRARARIYPRSPWLGIPGREWEFPPRRHFSRVKRETSIARSFVASFHRLIDPSRAWPSSSAVIVAALPSSSLGLSSTGGVPSFPAPAPVGMSSLGVSSCLGSPLDEQFDCSVRFLFEFDLVELP